MYDSGLVHSMSSLSGSASQCHLRHQAEWLDHYEYTVEFIGTNKCIIICSSLESNQTVLATRPQHTQNQSDLSMKLSKYVCMCINVII